MKKLVLDDKQIKHLVSEICRKISTEPWRPDVVVGINRGGLIPAVMISQYFSIKHIPLSVSLRDNEDCESNLWLAEDAFKGKNILIVDDINDTGATFNWVNKDWPSGCFPNDPAWKNIWNHNVRFAVLVDNLASKCNLKMDFYGMEINKAEDDVWIDFPWESWWTK